MKGTTMDGPEIAKESDAASASPPTSDGKVHAEGPLELRKLLRDVEVEVTLEIGRRRMRIADVLRLKPGQVLDLTKAAGEPLDIYVNGRLLGRGEAIVVGDRYGVRIAEFVAPSQEDDT
ncbi:MAG: flagellar motor switch protein FliN [Polyangiaceae bacterium]